MRLVPMTIALCAASAAWAQGVPSVPSPHPAIVRVVAPERDGVSYGSGTLVAINDTYGLVVTNWHVVRDAAAPVGVVFPNGFYSAATILRIDRDWDLAALAVWRPNVSPLPLANQAPHPGERLTVAGYGNGSYRAIAGQCTQYVSPGGNLPFEMLELSAPSRNGDSGGPILNDRGEIAGVLFGSAYGQTTGSYCGRVRLFLNSVADDFHRLPAQSAAIAKQQPAQLVPVPVAAISAQPTAQAASVEKVSNFPPRTISPSATADNHNMSPSSATAYAKPLDSSIQVKSPIEAVSWFEQIRNFLAVIGVVALLLQGLRMVGKMSG
jgi:hypothetical protein